MRLVRNVCVLMMVLLAAASASATDQIFMGFDEASQTMQAVVRGDAPFHCVITYDQSNPAGYIGDINQVPIDPTEQWGTADLRPVDPNRMTDVPDGTMNIITATAVLYNENEEYLGTLMATDTLYADVDEHVGIYTYGRDENAILPDSIRVSSAFCAWITHGTYTVPIVCEFPAPDGGFPDPDSVEVYVANGCQTGTECNEVCTPIDWDLFTWRISSRTGCIINLIMTYCDGTPGCICIWRSDDELPVQFTGFDAVAADGRVTVSWSTGAESELSMFQLVRSTEPDNPMSWELVARVPARNSAAGSHYSFADERVTNGVTYYYKLHVVDLAQHSAVYNINGRSVVINATPNAEAELPVEFHVAQNYPNPFNSGTTFSFTIPTAERVTLKVYDIMGRSVATVVDRDLQADSYTVNWSADDLPTGVYMYTLTAGNFSQTHKLLYLK